MTTQGYRLFHLETYTINGKRKWAGLFKKRNKRYALHRNLSTEAFEKIEKKMIFNLI
ncbi:hypothetical protein [Seonamhaeicola sp. S2-3]|uniref:hypothetical protein n=1 Tax=Seonamhaeicola sp. S2-3 TaxID=1936081 RepID=UPI0018DC03A4